MTLDGVNAKRILIALAKKFGGKTVRRCNYNHHFALKVVFKTGASQYLEVLPIGAQNALFMKLVSVSGKWEKLLHRLDNCECIVRGLTTKPENVVVTIRNVEQLAIDLELEGYLKLK